MRRILIMGLPGAGKTRLASQLKNYIDCDWFNADEIRKQFDDWDFTTEGRIRQSKRMRDLADKSSHEYVIADFVAPLVEMREIFSADFTIWMDTLEFGRFGDTNSVFVPPTQYNIRIPDFNYDVSDIVNQIKQI
jgi:adenylylsulfate kinase